MNNKTWIRSACETSELTRDEDLLTSNEQVGVNVSGDSWIVLRLAAGCCKAESWTTVSKTNLCFCALLQRHVQRPPGRHERNCAITASVHSWQISHQSPVFSVCMRMSAIQGFYLCLLGPSEAVNRRCEEPHEEVPAGHLPLGAFGHVEHTGDSRWERNHVWSPWVSWER